ncbi:conserved hypothetical protein [Cupriavidus phytorum]|uniref:Uncharacterized protein n=2 Tax=Cupriavidus TaxID=106589 RepID=A0A976AAV4_9BURK|nr:hypothetical protein C7416_10677 [Cupriavidus alkaliphilus]SOY74719.1 conserved hypothetical protein [Cupriavidus taiwanensis]
METGQAGFAAVVRLVEGFNDIRGRDAGGTRVVPGESCSVSKGKEEPRRARRTDQVSLSRALRLSVPAEARPAPVNRRDWLRQRKEELQAARTAARQRRNLLRAEIMSAAQDIAREERSAARLEAERLKAEARSARTYAREDERAAAKFERGQPKRPAAKTKTLAKEKSKLVSYAELLRLRK